MPVNVREKYSVDNVVNLIRKGGIEHSRAKDLLIKAYSKYFYSEIKNTINYTEFEDIFIDALNSFSENVARSEIIINNSKAYFKKIYTNKLYKYIETKKKKNKTIKTVVEEYSLSEDFGLDHTNKYVKLVFKLLDEIPEHCRNLILMKYYEGKSHNEIADLLGITVASSKAELSRCKKGLLKMIKKRLNDHE